LKKGDTMTWQEFSKAYDFTGKAAALTGGGGVLATEIACALAGCGANVAVLDRDLGLARKTADRITETGGRAVALYADVLDPAAMQAALDGAVEAFGAIDLLVNAAGGNNPKATTGPGVPFFDLPPEALRFVSDLNWLGTVIPCQVIGRHMAQRKQGVILNISSMNAFRPLTRIAAYSAAKAAVSNFTQWLAVYLAQEISPDLRVNAVAPGFFLTQQNRYLLTDKDTGAWTERAQRILDHTPMRRFGEPADLLGTVLWLLSPASRFVTGIVVPVDGGFSAFAGV
jgi:NAD(P)-dependent dehydrogenase (short-subunit alcohol dehydrogenase family)